jgi:hypothetical protein
MGQSEVANTRKVLGMKGAKFTHKEGYALSNIEHLDRETGWMEKMEKFGCVSNTDVTRSMLNAINCKLSL